MQTGKQTLGVETDEQWLEVLVKSVTTPIIGDVHMPRFPIAHVQQRVVGSHDEHAMTEGFKFQKYAKEYAEALGNPVHAGTKFLDFGVGWGRYPRLFSGDIYAQNIHGVDVDLEMINGCKTLGVPGEFRWIQPKGTLPYPDNTFDMIISFSVFSHLPEDIALAWATELSRVAKPGAIFVFTTEPRRFLDFIENIQEPAESAWHAGLARFKYMLPELKAKCDAGELAYIPTSGGVHLPASVYGDTVMPETYLKSKWAHLFSMRAYVDDPNAFWQAVVVMQKA
jgi:ubiquinone/menaquinone biosynthesis C-methylase UbiE